MGLLSTVTFYYALYAVTMQISKSGTLICFGQSFVSYFFIFGLSCLYLLWLSALDAVLQHTSEDFGWGMCISTLTRSEFRYSLSTRIQIYLPHGQHLVSDEMYAINYQWLQSIHVKLNRLVISYVSLVITIYLPSVLNNSISDNYFIGKHFVAIFYMPVNQIPSFFKVSAGLTYAK